MPSTFVPLPIPQVPQVAGVPALFARGAALPIPTLATGDFPGVLGAQNRQLWGIFPNGGGAPILQADSVASVEFAQDYRISDYPQEKGAFESYNKVQVPYQAKIGFLVNLDREPFLNAIGQQLASLELVQIVTPEISYPNANLTHYSYRRTARNGGVSMIMVEVWCEEVRVITTSQVGQSSTTPASANGASPAQDGTVQPDQTTPSPTNPVSGQPAPGPLNSGLPSPSGASPSTSLSSPTINTSFYGSNNLPAVPNAAASLTNAQISSVTTYSGAQAAALTSTTLSYNASVADALFPGLGVTAVGSATAASNFNALGTPTVPPGSAIVTYTEGGF